MMTPPLLRRAVRPWVFLCVLSLLAVVSASTTATASTATTRRTVTTATTTTTASTTTQTTTRTTVSRTTAVVNPETPVAVPAANTPPPGRRLSANQVLAIAGVLPKLRRVRAKYRGSYGGAYLKGPGRWQVSYFSRNGKEIGQVYIADASGRVLEQWTGFQVAWTMARGYPGAFGEHVNALYIWLPLCALFLLPFINPRRPFSLLHLDLLVLLSFSVSLAFFNHAHIYASVPLVYPPLLYLLVRMLALARPRLRAHKARLAPSSAAPLRLLVPVPWLAVGVVFLLGFRIGLNVTDGNVIDVGYAGVIGAQRIVDGKSLYGGYPSDNEHGDTYGPVNYEAYVPFEQIFGWSGRWDDLPAAHAAAIVFDLLAVALLFLLGRRVRGPTLGIALAYAWVSYPFTLFALESDSNDTLVAVLVLAALALASSPPARGAFAALAGLSKFAPLALAPLLGTHDLYEYSASGRRIRGTSGRTRGRAFLLRSAVFVAAFVLVSLLALVPALTHNSLHTLYARTIVYQDNRGSPFSVWGLYGGAGSGELQAAVQVLAVALALALAILPRRPDLVGLSAALATVILATQLGVDHWFYLYIPWFFPLVMLALLGRFGEQQRHPRWDTGVPGAVPA
jgi:hypothetical protein